jgi:hypothetical protein
MVFGDFWRPGPRQASATNADCLSVVGRQTQSSSTSSSLFLRRRDGLCRRPTATISGVKCPGKPLGVAFCWRFPEWLLNATLSIAPVQSIALCERENQDAPKRHGPCEVVAWARMNMRLTGQKRPQTRATVERCSIGVVAISVVGTHTQARHAIAHLTQRQAQAGTRRSAVVAVALQRQFEDGFFCDV